MRRRISGRLENGAKGELTACVAVIMPARDAASFIDEALESVIRQRVEGVDIIVVDDGSRDDTAQRAGRYQGVRVVDGPQLGIAAARNFGLEQVRAEFVCFLDADDRWRPGKLERQLDRMQRQPELGMMVAGVENFLDGLGSFPRWAVRHPKNYLAPSATCFRAWVFERLGYFDVELGHGEDIDFYLRVFDAGIAHTFSPEIDVERRIHAANHTHDRTGSERAFIGALAKSIARRQGSRRARC